MHNNFQQIFYDENNEKLVEQNEVAELQKDTESQDKKDDKKKGFFGGAKSFLSKGAGYVKNKVVDIKHSIDEKGEAKKLEKDIELTFNKKALIFDLIIPGGTKSQKKKIYAQINYDTKRITLFGIVTINPNMYFVDSNKFKFSVDLVRANSIVEIQIGETIYKRPSTDIEFSIKKDAETIKQVTTIIDNSISIGDNVDISKTKIGQ